MSDDPVSATDRLSPEAAPASGQSLSPRDSRRTAERAWRAFLAGGLLLTALYVVMPYEAAAGALYVGMTLGAAILVGLAVYRRRPFSPASWILLACALAVTTIGHFTWYWLDLHGLQPFPSAADVFYLAAYPMFIGALWTLGHRPGHDGGAILDALIVGISAATLGWALLITPYVNDPTLGMLQLVVSAAYPVADLILLPMVLRLLLQYRVGIRAHQFLLAGMIAYLLADILYAHGTSSGWYAPGGLIDGLWLLGYVLFVSAVWHPTAAAEPEMRPWYAELSGRRLTLLGTAAVIVPAVMLISAAANARLVRVAAVATILLFVLVMLRLAGLMRRVRRQAEQLERLARTDPLTGAANRRSLQHELRREISRAWRTESPLCVAFFDLDHFKQYNDIRGHTAGDVLLRELVVAWNEALRPTDLLARAGGEEFIGVFPDTGVEQGRSVVERLRALVPYGQTCSAGIAVYQSGERAEELIRRADRAVYAAKEGGRDRTVIAYPE